MKNNDLNDPDKDLGSTEPIYTQREGKEIDNEDESEDDIEEEEDVNDENGDGCEGNAYTFQFVDEMDPLSFTEEDAFGIQPYQQFERLENDYEALAEKKRKTLAGNAQNNENVAKRPRYESMTEASMEEIMEVMNYGRRRRKSRKLKKKGRRKGSRNKLNPEITKKLGNATLHYAHGRHEEAIAILKEVVRLAPNLPDPYHTLGLIYNTIGDNKKAMSFYMLAAHLTPKDSSLWKLLLNWSLEQGDAGQARYCLSKAIKFDPDDVSLRRHQASIYVEIEDYQRAAESFEAIARLCPEDIEALKKSIGFHKKCGQKEQATNLLEEYFIKHPTEVDFSMIDILAAIYMENNEHVKALQRIEHAKQIYCGGADLPLYLAIKAGICNVRLGEIEKAEAILTILEQENICNCWHLVREVADSFLDLALYDYALKYFHIVEGAEKETSGLLYMKMAQCYSFLGNRAQAIEYFYKGLQIVEDNIDARLTLSSFLLEDEKVDEAISVLSPPTDWESKIGPDFDKSKAWWFHGKIKLKLCHIYKARGQLNEFADTIIPTIRESLCFEGIKRKVRNRKKLSKKVLFERIKVLNDGQNDTVFQGFRPVASTLELAKALRAKKLLEKKANIKEANKSAALAAGMDWNSDDSDDEYKQHTLRESPLPDLLINEEYHHLIIDLCKALATLKRYWEAMEIINMTLKVAFNHFSNEKEQKLRSLGAHVAQKITDPRHGWSYARDIALKHPYSIAAWNCFYKVVSSWENRYTKYSRFLHAIKMKHRDSVPPILITGHQFTMINQHQIAVREYLEAYKLMPDNPLINLCVGSALINLAVGLRLQNRHQCLLQGLAFLFNNLRICNGSQESLFNLARACHHVGLVSLAASYYEKVLAITEKEYLAPKLPNENQELNGKIEGVNCDLRREAAYNLHLIYKKSGANDLARQILRDYCTF